MKVSISDLEVHLMSFLKKVADTMPSSLHKWIGGAMVAGSAMKVESFLKEYADADGMIDIDSVKRLVDAGFDSSGGEVVLPMGGALQSFGFRPVNIKITREDTDRFFAGFST